MRGAGSTKPTADSKPSPLASSLGSRLAFRHDAVDSPVVAIRSVPGLPLASVEYHDGTVALYDFEIIKLLGQVRLMHLSEISSTCSEPAVLVFSKDALRG